MSSERILTPEEVDALADRLNWIVSLGIRNISVAAAIGLDDLFNLIHSLREARKHITELEAEREWRLLMLFDCD